MLTIRPDHMSALAAAQSAIFSARMLEHLREVFPVEVAGIDDAKLLAVIEKACKLGEDWGITTEPLIERLIELLVSFAELRRNPLPQWISEIVTHANRSGARKLLMLEDGLRFRDNGMQAEKVPGTFSQRVDEAFSHEEEAVTSDRARRRQWRAIAAGIRKPRSIPQKSLKSSYSPPQEANAQVKFPPARLPSKGGDVITVPCERKT